MGITVPNLVLVSHFAQFATDLLLSAPLIEQFLRLKLFWEGALKLF